MRTRNRTATLHVYLGVRRRPEMHLAGHHTRAVHDQPGQQRLRVEHLHVPVTDAHAPLVGQLATGLGVERCATQDDLDVLAGHCAFDGDAVADQAHDRGLCRHGGVADELRRAGRGQDGVVGRKVGRLALLLPCVLPGPVTLLGHQPPEAFVVDRQPVLGSHLQGEVDREAMRVVQLEGNGPRHTTGGQFLFEHG